jgi:hypothetical protein
MFEFHAVSINYRGPCRGLGFSLGWGYSEVVLNPHERHHKKHSAGLQYKLSHGLGPIEAVFASIIGGALWTFVAPEATFVFGAVCAFLSLFFFLQIRIKPVAS